MEQREHVTMGCFCRDLVPLPPQAEPGQSDPIDTIGPENERDTGLEQPLVPALAAWLQARWLPAPRWEPNPEWLEIEWPEPPFEPGAMAVLSGLIGARAACQTLLQVDPAEPGDLMKLTRIVGTLNRRTEQLQRLDEDRRPWDALALLNHQLDTVRDAIAQGVFEPQQQDPEPLAPWRPVIARLKALAPFVALGQTLAIDLADPLAPAQLAKVVRQLRQVTLPPLEDAALVLRLVARMTAIGRIWTSLGADPRPYPFQRVADAVRRKMETVVQQIPEHVTLVHDHLLGMPTLQPNPSVLVNQPTVQLARKLTPRVLEQFRWKVPRYEELDLLTTGNPVAGLVGCFGRLGANPIRATPCGQQCDARAATGAATGAAPGVAAIGVLPGMAAVVAPRVLTTKPGSGTGAGPAG